MKKFLEEYNQELNKLNNQLEAKKNQQKKIEAEIEEVKSDVKDNTKKGRFTDFLRGKNTERLAKLLANKQIIDFEVEALSESYIEGDKNVIKKALNYLEAAQREVDKIYNNFEAKRIEGRELIKRGQELTRTYSYEDENREKHKIFSKAKSELQYVLNAKMTEGDEVIFARGYREDIDFLKEILERD